VTPANRSRQRLLDVLSPVVLNLGFDLEDLTVTAVGRRSVVRVIVDSDEGVDLDAVAVVSRAISDVLDAEGEDAFAGPFVLEVSSPGVDRPLVEARHWRRSIGRLVEVSVDGASRSGRIVSVDATAVVIDTGSGAEPVAFERLGPGRVQIEFARPGRPDSDPDSDPDETEEG
jgi:ribosome maturation factor RimP